MFSIRVRHAAAFTLLEVLIVIVVVGVLAGMMVPSSNPGAAAQLQAVASVLGREIEYTRNLAVLNSDNYKITFDLANNKWTLTHSGSNTALDALPLSAFHLSTDPPTQQVVSLASLPSLGTSVRLSAVWSLANSVQTVSDIEFTPLGGTTRSPATMIWLTAGSGASTRYISVRVNPVTGLFWVENFQTTAPNAAAFAGS